jgi:predicted RNase H-like HicB family nuclease
MKLRVLLEKEEDGGFSVVVPALPGCFTEGDTIEEALANAKEAAEGWLEANNSNPCDIDSPLEYEVEL